MIDDEQPLVSVINDGFTGYGHEFFIALAGSSGLEIVGTGPIDLVISELRLWDMTGWLKTSSEEENIQEQGVDRIARKPIENSKLEKAIREVVHEARAKKRNCTDRVRIQGIPL